MAYCERCGAEYEKNIFGVIGNTFFGTAQLCPDCSAYWPVYLARSKALGIAAGLVLKAFLHGIPVDDLVRMSAEEIHKRLNG